MNRSSLLMVTRNLPPLRGGMERLNDEMVATLSSTFDVTVIAPKGTDPGSGWHPSTRLLTSPLGGVGGFLAWAFFAATWCAFRRRPRWVVGGSGLVAPIVCMAGLWASATALYLHGLDIIVDHALYRRVWLPCIRRVTLVLSNSRNTASLAQDAGIARSRIRIINPGTSLPAHAKGDGSFRRAHGLGDGPLLLSVGRLTRRKGLTAFVQDVLPALVARHPGMRLAVVGGDAVDALVGGTGHVEALRAAVSTAGLGAHVAIVGPVDEASLAAAYRDADVHVFPVVAVPGDVEGFGMVAIEAAAHGLPTVAYAVGGVPDAVAQGESGILVAAGNASLFAAALDDVIRRGRAGYAEGCLRFASGFGWPRFGAQMTQALAASTSRAAAEP
ncbi:glycosyltransferase family 4 protein [Luteibacter yeojuensis]|uniref:Glycosyltransferase subfamily 4-like N-terminal domain-containing protein n=1 Tax=Luteibacter yeojuensis TaxID=345309 RepID=A0A0F3KIT9_9GAMM|nr:glycosyltransferase family 4 protein [Luteibacter yeojuensis]KJV30922.1 hypothetical protein VI08_14345 [Luteibacter yeojuensis]